MKYHYTSLKNSFLVLFLLLTQIKIAATPADSLINAMKSGTDVVKRETARQLAMLHYNSINDTSLYYEADNLLALLSENDHLGLFYEQLGNLFLEEQKYDEAYVNLQKSIQIYQEQGDETGTGFAKYLMGKVYVKLSDFESSMNDFMDAIRIFKEEKELVPEALAIESLGMVFQDLGQYREAIEFYDDAGKIWKDLQDTLKIAENYFHLAEIARLQGKQSVAILLQEKSIALKQSIKNENGIAASWFALGQIYEHSDEFILAESHFQKALALYKKLGDRYGMAKTQTALGSHYLSIEELTKARNLLGEALIVADYINSVELLVDIYKNLSKLYEKENIYDKAIEYYKNYTQLKDSLFSEKRYYKVAELKLRLDNKEKSKVIEKLRDDNYFQAKMLKTQRYLLITSIVVAVLIFIIAINVVMQNRRRKRINRELKQQKQKAVEADRLKSSFLANMSHEIRSPMNAIIGFSNLILESNALDAENQQFMGYIKQSGSNLIQLVDDIIDIAKIEAGQLKIRMEEFNLNEMMQNLFVTIQTGFGKSKDSKVSIHLNMPEDVELPLIISDELRIKQVLTNFISNAIKFTEKGFIEFGYEIIPGNQLLFYTKDSGPGIAEKDKELVFQRFGQVEDTYTRNTSGTGLGLAISKSIVKLLGGEIWFDSIEGKGTTFFFKIPVTYSGAKSKPAIVEQFNIDSYDWHKKVILVAEDDDMNFNVASSILRKTNAQLIRAVNGLEAVHIALSNQHINLIIMDIQMPAMNGYEATLKIKKERDIPVIAVTAYAMPGEKQKSIEAGCNGFITKPYNMIELLSKISFLIS